MNSEQEEANYIKHCGEKGVESIVETLIDNAPKFDEVTTAVLKKVLAGVLEGALDNLEIARWASKCCDGPDFEDWTEEQL